MIRSLLICDDVPDAGYGTGQRLLAHRRALSALGECRVLHLTDGERPRQLDPCDFVAPVPFPHTSSRLAWALRHLTFAESRPDRRYVDILERIRTAFPYDIALCSFFRNSCAAPTHLVPCILDVDAITVGTGALTRMLRPLTLRMMRRRARAFRVIYVIRRSDKVLFEPEVSREITVLPGISATAQAHAQPVRKENRVLFVGATKWKPNAAAVDWLLAAGIPRALHDIGHELRLVGAGTERIPAASGLSCAGFVEDLAAEYRQAKLVLCPILDGGGANIKLAEAVQSGCPVLASAHAAAGYEDFLVPGRHIEVFETQAALAGQLLSLLRDPERLQRLRAGALSVSRTVLNQNHYNGIIARDVRRLMDS